MIQSHILYCISMFLLILNIGWMVDGSDEAVLITGGTYNRRSAEVFLPETGHSCRLSDLPDERLDHTQDGALTCGGFGGQNQRISCLKWSPDSGTWTQSHNLTEDMFNHVSWTPDSSLGTYLMGGAFSFSSEMVKPDGSVEQRFVLKYDTR